MTEWNCRENSTKICNVIKTIPCQFWESGRNGKFSVMMKALQDSIANETSKLNPDSCCKEAAEDKLHFP